MSSRKVVFGNPARCCLLPALAAVLLLGLAACGPAPTATPAPTASPGPPSPTTAAPQHAWELPAGQVLFIDRHVHVDGTCVEGECLPGPMIDFPTYSFDPETGTLDSRLVLEVSDDLKVLYGNGMSLGGIAGGGAATGLTGVYTVPAEIEGLSIVQVDRDGTAYLEHGGALLVLAPAETWTNTTEEVREQGTGKARLITTDTIVNYGILDKDNILAPAPSP